MVILLFLLFIIANVGVSATTWTTLDFGGKATVEDEVTWTTLTFGGKTTVQDYTWGDWSSWWNFTYADSSSTPTQTNPNPANNSVGNGLTPTLSITVDDDNSLDLLNVTWSSNSSGSWINFGVNNSINISGGSVTIYQTNSNFSVKNTTYYWKVTVTDETYTDTKIYNFKTLVADEIIAPSVTTNIATPVNSTNATLNGYLDSDGYDSYGCTVWFSYGTTTTYGTNTTNQTLVYTGDSFSNVTGTINPGILYHYRTVANNSNSTVYGSDMAFLTRPNVTTNLAVNNGYSPDTLNISWTAGDGANNTYIERDIVSSWTRGDGVLIYNNTGNYYNDIGLAMGTLYYYQVWSYTTWTYNPTVFQYSGSYASGSNTTDNVNPPYNGNSSYLHPHVNLTWTRGNHSNRDIVVQNNASYPASPTDGWIRQNDTTTFFNESITYSTYFTVWSYNNTAKLYSATGLNIPWGALGMQCYDETNNTALTFDVLVTNEDLDTLYLQDLTNIYYLNLNDIPYGDNTIFYVSSDNHESRTYYYDLEVNNFYNLTFYLPLAIPSGGTEDPDYDPENESYSTLYLLTVVDELNEGVEDVKIEIMRYINETKTYESVTILTSDANGQADVYLFAGTVYKVKLSKTGYITRTDDYIPSDSIYTRTFKIYFEETEPTPPDVEPENIIFTGEISSNILYLNYTDSMQETINTTIYVYEINLSTGIETLFGTNSTTDTDSFQTSFSGINTSNTYKVILFYNHATFGNQVKTLLFDGNYTPPTTPTVLNTLLTAIIGTNPFGWANFLIWLFLVAGFYYADPRDSSKILIFLGGMFLFINVVVGFNTTFITVAGGAIPILFIVVGIIMMWNESHKKVTI